MKPTGGTSKPRRSMTGHDPGLLWTQPPPPGRPASIGDKIAAWPIKAAQLAAELRALGADARNAYSRSSSPCVSWMTCLQPLLASDNNDTSGNSIKAIVDSFEHKTKDELRDFRDAEGPNRSPAALAKALRDPAGTRSPVEGRHL